MQVIFRNFFNFYNIFFTVLDFSDERSRFAPYREDKAGNSFPQISEDFSDQVGYERIRELEMENEVLRRAAAYLSQAHITPPK